MRAGLVRFARNRMALFGAVVLLCLLLLVVLTPVIYPDDPFKLAGPALQPPGGRFLLGTDTLGRDVAAEIAYGARAPRSSLVSVRPSPPSSSAQWPEALPAIIAGRPRPC